MQETKEHDHEYPVVLERNLLERIYYHHGLFCANHPAFIIFICGVLICLCSAPIITFSPLTAKIPSEWNETISVNGSNSEKPNWLKEKPAAYIQQIVVTVLIEPVNNRLLVPYGIHEAFQPVFKILQDINEYKHTDRKGKRLKLSDLCFMIRHHDTFLLGGEGKILPKKGCLQISPANLWTNITSFQNDKNIMLKIYGKPSKNIVSLKENIFGVPLRAIGLFPLTANDECLVIRYAVTTVLREFNPSFMQSLKTDLEEKLTPLHNAGVDDDAHAIVHIHYEGDNIIEIYHLCFTYFMVFIYLVFSVSKIEMVKSKLGLAISAVVTVVASLSMAAGLCIFFGMVPSVSSSEIFPYLVIIIGLENILVITRSIVSTHPCLPVPIRVAEGLSREGRSITLNLTTELLLLLCGYLTFVPAVQEFCMVGGVGVLTDFFLQIVFFATVLSIDLSRLEPPSQYLRSPHVDIEVCNTPLSSNIEDPDKQSKLSPKTTEPEQSNNWSDVATYFYNPMKIFSLRQDLPKRLNFAYFWARTRIVQRGIMVFAIMYLIYITSVTVINKEDFSSSKDIYTNDSYQNLLTTNISVSEQMSSLNNPLGTTNQVVKYSTTVTPEDVVSKEAEKSFQCKDDLKSQGLWRNLSRQHWPELLDHYGVNVMDRYISVLPPIHLHYKVDNLHNVNPMSKDSESISKFYQEFSKDLRWTSRSYALELAGFVKILYLITGIFIIVTVYLIYQLLSTRPKHRLKKTKPSPKSIVLLSSPIFLDGHQQIPKTFHQKFLFPALGHYHVDLDLSVLSVSTCAFMHFSLNPVSSMTVVKSIECLHCNENVIVSSCLEGTVRVWDSKTTECIYIVERKSRPSQIWSLHCWKNFVAMGCSNGDLEIWDFSKKRMCFLHESGPCGVTAIRFIFESNILVISRLNGFLDFFELGDRLSSENVTENSKYNALLPSMRKKTNLQPSAWKTIMNSVPSDAIPCHSCRAHTKTISVLETCKDLVISASFDNLLKVFRSQTGACLFTLRAHTSPVTTLTTEPDVGAISGSADGEIRLWSLTSGECTRFPSKHSTSIVAIVCTYSRIASLDITETLCIWDRFTKRFLQCLPQFPDGCLGLTCMSDNTAVCVGRDTMVVVELTRGQILRVVELEQKYDHILINHVLKCDENTVVCDYGERLVLLTFHESADKNS